MNQQRIFIVEVFDYQTHKPITEYEISAAFDYQAKEQAKIKFNSECKYTNKFNNIIKERVDFIAIEA